MKTFECPICKNIHDKATASVFFIYTNSIIQKRLTCSKECRAKYMNLFDENRCDFTFRGLQKKQVLNLYCRKNEKSTT